MNAIEVKGLKKSYQNFELQDINFDLPTGTIMGLVGENGAGKSTIIKLIMNAIKADEGSVAVLGISNFEDEFVEIKQEIGVVLDEAYFPEILNAKNINKIMSQTYRKWDEKTYYGYIERFKLPIDKKFQEYSRGMKMKLSIAVALSHEPKLLILDEATSGLDPMIRDEILDVFHEFTRDESHSILISSHIISDLEKICDYITFVHKGKLMLSEEKDSLLEKYAVLKLTKEQLETIPEEAIVGEKNGRFGCEVLVEKEKVNPSFVMEHTTLEDIVLYMAKEDL